MTSGRRHPRLFASRFTAAEGALIEAAAKVEGKTIQEYLRGVVLPAVFETLERARQSLRNGGSA